MWEKIVGPVKLLQDQYILGITGLMVPVTFWFSADASVDRKG